MRVPANRVVVAIFGPSCSGKTTVAAGLAKALGAQTRHCGEVLKTKASALGKRVPDLADDEHAALDAETREVVTTSGASLVVEGGFLNHVLSDPSTVLLIDLTCADTERAARFGKRTPGVMDPLDSIRRRDAEDAALRGRLFVHPPRTGDFVLDTTTLSAEQCVEAILARIRG